MKLINIEGEGMSIKIFTSKETIILSNNQYIKNVSIKAITYTDEFKCTFIEENEKGKLPRMIFENHGFDIDIIGWSVLNQQKKMTRSIYPKRYMWIIF